MGLFFAHAVEHILDYPGIYAHLLAYILNCGRPTDDHGPMCHISRCFPL